MDADGYPTEEELAKVREWPYQDCLGLMAYLKERWYAAEMGYWYEGDYNTEEYGGEPCRQFQFQISTAGWSGNEGFIEAMMANRMFWTLCWYSSRRGGHYEFRVRKT